MELKVQDQDPNQDWWSSLPSSSPPRFVADTRRLVAGTPSRPTTAEAAPAATRPCRRSTTPTRGGDWRVVQPRVQPGSENMCREKL